MCGDTGVRDWWVIRIAKQHVFCCVVLTVQIKVPLQISMQVIEGKLVNLFSEKPKKNRQL